MRVVAFAPSLSAVSQDAGGVAVEGFPLTTCYVQSVPAQITIPVVIAVCAAEGQDYNPRKYIVGTAPNGDRVGTLEFAWQWPDTPSVPVKFRVFAQYLPMNIQAPGIHTLALCDNLDATESDTLYPLPVLQRKR
ncbi:MAG: hypothetical protein ACPGVG_00240 [Mycobacterium sp.]